MTDRTDAIKAAIEATAPAELQWLPNPGHEPEIPEGWEIAGARFSDGDEYTVPPNGRILSLADANVTEYAIRRKPTQPTLTDLTPTDEDPAELRKRMVLLALNGNWLRAQTIADRICEPVSAVLVALRELCTSGDVAQSIDDGWPVFRLNTNEPMVNIFEPEPEPAPEPIRQRSAAMVIGGTLTSVGATFAALETGGRLVALSLTTDQARWLGQYVGGEVKLTVEVTL